MNEQELGKEIAKLLDLSAAENIKQSTLYRLQSVRRAALENCHPTLEIMNSGNGTSVFGVHAPHFHPGKMLLLLAILFVFTMVPATYWQFLERGKLSDTTVLVDHMPTERESATDDEHELIDEYIDDVLKLVDDLSTNARVDAMPEVQDDLSTDVAPLMDESEVTPDIPAETTLESTVEPIENAPVDVRMDNELDEWMGSRN
ncbi:MAG: DUF3619 family protein [Nitrosomonas sp.]|nr:DUF3619 family protein [Nitrosomonas sp.]